MILPQVCTKDIIWHNSRFINFVRSLHIVYSKESGLEIDFVTQNNGEVILIEVKAKDGRTKAGTEVLTHKEKYKDVVKMIRLKDTNVGSFNNIDTFPAYMSFLVK